MKTKKRFLFTLLMAIVMMAMSPAKVWAQDVLLSISIDLYGQDGRLINADIYNRGTAYFYDADGLKQNSYGGERGEFIFAAEEKVYGFSFAGWYKDNEFVTTDKTFTDNVTTDGYFRYVAHYVANANTAIPNNPSYVSLYADIDGEGEATFELEGYPGVSVVLVATGTTVKAVATTTSTTEYSYMYGSAYDSNDKEVDYDTEESSLEFEVVGDTNLGASFSTVEGGEGGDEGETTYTALNVGKNVVNIDGYTFFNFTSGDAGTYRFYSEGDVDLDLGTEDGNLSVVQGNNDANGVNFDWSFTLAANSTYTIFLYISSVYGSAENCTVYVSYEGEGSGEGGGSGESNNIKIELPIQLYDKDNTLFNYIYNVNTAYFNLGSEKKSSGSELSSGEYTFTAEDKVDGFSFVGWYDDNDNLITTENPYTANVESNILYFARYKANETTVIPNNPSFVSLEARIYGEGEATFELEGYPGVSVVLVETGTTVKAVATTTSTTEFGYMYGSARDSNDEPVVYDTEESSLEFKVVGNTILGASFSTVEGGEGGETPTLPALNIGTNSELTFPVSNGRDAIATFTPSASGHYKFVISPAMGLAIFETNPYFPVASDMGSGEVAALDLVANQTYEIHIINQTATTGSITITEVFLPSLAVGNNTVHIYPYDEWNYGNPKYLYTFTPTETGTYTFAFSNSDAPITINIDLGENANAYTVLELSDFAVALTAETTYRLYVDGDETEYESATLTISKVEGSAPLPTHEREMAYEWGTLCLPFPVAYDAANGNYKLYTLTAASESALTFTEIATGTTIEAGTPMAIKAVGKKNAETGKYDISITGSGAVDFSAQDIWIELENGYEMSGSFRRYSNITKVYFIAQNQFWWAESPITLPAYRALIDGPTPSSGAPLRIVEADGEAEGITTVSSDEVGVTIGYDLMGRLIGEQQKGLQIRDGKVIMVK